MKIDLVNVLWIVTILLMCVNTFTMYERTVTMRELIGVTKTQTEVLKSFKGGDEK